MQDYRIIQYRIFDLPSMPDGMIGGSALWVEVEHYKVVGACLAAARRGVNVTQQELAARLDKPQSFVSEYERGQRRVDVVELLVISRALDVDPLELFVEIARSAGQFRSVALPITL
jgi:ribosome-binding protein aMBF1 (putative translation factor)